MQVFISWSGDRSKRTAELISGWLKHVIQALDPWMSTDIEKGKRWGAEISGKLEKSTAGIICLTRDNINEKWILFEAGALSKMSADSYVCTFLLDINPEDIESPLADFQNTKFERKDMLKLVHTLNSALSKVGERPLDDKVLDGAFEMYWPALEGELRQIIDEKPQKTGPTRSPNEIMAEILEIVRSINRRDETKRLAEQLVATRLEALQQIEESTPGLGGTAGSTGIFYISPKNVVGPMRRMGLMVPQINTSSASVDPEENEKTPKK